MSDTQTTKSIEQLKHQWNRARDQKDRAEKYAKLCNEIEQKARDDYYIAGGEP